MKIIAAFLLLFGILSCSKDKTANDPPVLIGHTYSGSYINTDQKKVFIGYLFYDSFQAFELTMSDSITVLTQTKVIYTYAYPSVIINSSLSGNPWEGEFNDSGKLSIKGVLMTKR